MFTYRPLIDNIRLSFFRWNISSPSATFVGFDNYKEWLTRDDTRTIVLNTLVFTGFAVIGSMVLGLILALILDQKLFGRNAVRSIAFAPFALSGAAIGVAFQLFSILTLVLFRIFSAVFTSLCLTSTRSQHGHCLW